MTFKIGRTLMTPDMFDEFIQEMMTEFGVHLVTEEEILLGEVKEITNEG